jgi:hypothetical protein
MTDFPRKVRIGPFDYKVVPMSALEMFAKDRAGECDNLAQELRIGECLTNQKKATNLIHEMLHALWYVNVLSACGNAEDVEETMVRNLEFGLAQVIRDNPKVINWIGENLRK